MIVRSNSASIQCFLFVIFSCLAIMLSRISASGVECVHGFTQTGEDYSNTISNLFGKSLICHNNGRVKLINTWCDMQSTLYAS